MARKSGDTPRKSTSSRKSAATQPNPVTPIRESTGTGDNGAAQLDPGIHDEIRARAYELYQERGGQHGFDQEDWQRAETEILARHERKREKSA